MRYYFSKIFLLLILFITVNYSQSVKKVAITIDDLPVASVARETPVSERQKLVDELVASLKKENIPIIGFINENKLYENGSVTDARIQLVKTWLNAGFDLGNHTFSHKSANKVSIEEYKQDILEGEKICIPLVKEHGKQFNYFRHPFLQTGLNLEVKHGIESFLKNNGYTIAPVTIDNSEWIYASAYEKAFSTNDLASVGKIAKAYIDYMKAKVEWYEKKSNELFGRNISHILLIHANRLNAQNADKLFGIFREKKYSFISTTDALKDEAYKSKDTFIKDNGISWMDRWALTSGKQKEFFAGEPRADKWVMDYANIESE